MIPPHCVWIWFLVKNRGWAELKRPVNLHPLFLFWKPGSVCDPEKKLGTLLFEKNRVQKTKVIVIQKEKKQPGPTTPITAIGCRQCFSLCFVQLKSEHCRKPHFRNGVMNTFRPGLFSFWIKMTLFFWTLLFHTDRILVVMFHNYDFKERLSVEKLTLWLLIPAKTLFWWPYL